MSAPSKPVLTFPKHVCSPCRVLSPDCGRVAWTLGNLAFVFDPKTQKTVQLSTAHTAPIRALDSRYGLLVLAGDDRRLTVFDTTTLEKKFHYEHTKKIGCAIVASADTVVFADKFGEVYRAYVGREPRERVQPQQRPLPTAETDECMDDMCPHELLFGHLTVVTSLSLSHDGTRLLSGDKDEKVRISRFPDTHDIECFLMGHQQFISSAQALGDRLVVTASGDGSVKLWNQSGVCVDTYETGGIVSVMAIADDHRAIYFMHEDAPKTILRMAVDLQQLKFSADVKAFTCSQEVLGFAVSEASNDIYYSSRTSGNLFRLSTADGRETVVHEFGSGEAVPFPGACVVTHWKHTRVADFRVTHDFPKRKALVEAKEKETKRRAMNAASTTAVISED